MRIGLEEAGALCFCNSRIPEHLAWLARRIHPDEVIMSDSRIQRRRTGSSRAIPRMAAPQGRRRGSWVVATLSVAVTVALGFVRRARMGGLYVRWTHTACHVGDAQARRRGHDRRAAAQPRLFRTLRPPPVRPHARCPQTGLQVRNGRLSNVRPRWSAGG